MAKKIYPYKEADTLIRNWLGVAAEVEDKPARRSPSKGGSRNTYNVGDLYSWSKGPSNTVPDFPEGYVAQCLKYNVRNILIPIPAVPLQKSFEGYKTHPKTGAKVLVTKYKTTNLTLAETERFYKEVLAKFGAPSTTGNIVFIKAWRQMEGAKATYNPFNTTQKKGEVRSNFNTHYVQNYFSFADGVDATYETIKNGNYTNIMRAFKKGIPDQPSAQKLANLLQRKATFDQTAVDALINSW